MKYIKNTLILLFLCVTFLQSCKTNSLVKSEVRAQNKIVLDSLRNLNNYKVEVDVMYPFNTMATTQVANALLWNTGDNANRIDVQGEGNFLKIENDTLTGYLPFIGERRLSAGPYGGTDLAIQFEEKLENLQKTVNEDQGRLELLFKAKQKGSDNEVYNIRLDIYPNKKVAIDVTPVYRTFIKYNGRLVDVDKE